MLVVVAEMIAIQKTVSHINEREYASVVAAVIVISMIAEITVS